MAYERLNLVKGNTFTADHLKHIEDGIVSAGSGTNVDNFSFDIAYSVPTDLTLNDIAYEGKTYRDIFINDARMSWDMETDRLDITPYPTSSMPEYDTTHSYTGVRSLKITNNSTTSKYYNSKSDSGSNQPVGGIYLAVMVNLESYTSGEFGISMSSGAIPCYDIDKAILNTWQMASTYYTGDTPTGHVYIGGFKEPKGTAYLDNAIAINLGYFDKAPSKEILDTLYINYCNILKNNAKVNSKIIEAVDNNNPLIQPILTGKYNYLPEDAHKAIVNAMNKKAFELGMTNTTYYNPYGGSIYDFNVTSARDLMKLTVHSAGYRKVMDYLSLNGSRTMRIYGPNERDYTVENHIQSDFDTAYVNVHGSGSCPYQMLAGKGGGWSSPANQRVYCYTLIAEVEEKMVAAVVSRVSTGDSTHTGREYRLMSMIQLLDICAKKIKGEQTSDEVTYCEYACACIIPQIPITRQNRTFETLYEKNADTKFNPASTSKVMSALVMMDVGFNAYEMHELVPEEFCDSGTTFTANKGDIMLVDDAMFVNLIVSNGPNTLALSRHFGNKILAEREKFGLFRTVTVQLGSNIVINGGKNEVLEGTKFVASVESTNSSTLNVTVTMGGTDITSTAVSDISGTTYAKKQINIPSTTGNVVITAQ